MSTHSRRAYVVMPFAKCYGALYDTAIRPAAICAGLRVARYDEMEVHGDVSARIAHGISSADLLVAVVTDRNANVFYEIGFARAINKTILILASMGEEIPAFLDDLPCVVYGSSLRTLREGLVTAFHDILRADPKWAPEQRPSVMAHS